MSAVRVYQGPQENLSMMGSHPLLACLRGTGAPKLKEVTPLDLFYVFVRAFRTASAEFVLVVVLDAIIQELSCSREPCLTSILVPLAPNISGLVPFAAS